MLVIRRKCAIKVASEDSFTRPLKPSKEDSQNERQGYTFTSLPDNQLLNSVLIRKAMQLLDWVGGFPLFV